MFAGRLLFAGVVLALSAAASAEPAPPRGSFVPVASAEACPADRSPIMILGTYHMSNPGFDAVNIEADDVLSPRRQREIETLVERLARFRPTEVMLEGGHKNPVFQQRYERYLAGAHKLGCNESEQIGYRLAKKAGLKEVTPVDYPMWMSGQTPDELDYEARPAVVAPPAAGARELTPDELLLRRSTVADYLAIINDPARWRPGHLAYMELFEPEPGNMSIYARTDSLTNWYKRNFRIWANIVRKTDRPKDRAILIVGSGHLAILRQLAQDMTGFCLVEPTAYLRESD